MRLVLTVQRDEHLGIEASQPLQLHLLATDRDLARDHPELQPLARQGGLELGGVTDQLLGGGQRLLREDRGRSRLDDPGLLPRDALQVVAEIALVVQRDRRHHRHQSVGHVGRVPEPAEPDLHHRHVDRRVCERRVRHRGEHLEEAHPDRLVAIDQLDERDHLVVQLGESFRRHRLTVDADPLRVRLEVRAGEPTGPQTEASEQRVDHARGRGLAVRPRHMDHRERPLRVAEHVDQGAHPVEGRVDLALRPPSGEGLLDPAHDARGRSLAGCSPVKCRKARPVRFRT